jgi:AcrR family transcriptional regulator
LSQKRIARLAGAFGLALRRKETILGIFAADARKLGKSARTRARLMDAAVTIFARDGYEAASVNEIARAAEVANGTFYLHFKDKDEIAGAVVFNVLRRIADQISNRLDGVKDEAECICFIIRQMVALALGEPEWGMAFFRATWFSPQLREQSPMIRRILTRLEHGAARGDFKVEASEYLASLVGGMILLTVYRSLSSGREPDAASQLAELVLRMLGVSPTRAKNLAWKQLEPLKLTLSESYTP